MFLFFSALHRRRLHLFGHSQPGQTLNGRQVWKESWNEKTKYSRNGEEKSERRNKVFYVLDVFKSFRNLS